MPHVLVKYNQRVSDFTDYYSLQILELKFLNFTLELSEQCKSDYVEVYDGEDDEAELVGRYCGQMLPPVIVASDNALFMR